MWYGGTKLMTCPHQDVCQNGKRQRVHQAKILITELKQVPIKIKQFKMLFMVPQVKNEALLY